MKIIKILLIVAAVYVGIVVAFETFIGYAQPQNDGTLVIVTTDEDGNENPRVLSRLEVDGQAYVAVNHWPRSWYHDVLDHPQVEITFGGETGSYVAVPVEGAEHDKVMAAHPIPTPVRFLMGFAPRYFVRLDAAY